MAWTSVLVCGHSISTVTKPPPGSYLTCLSTLCQGQRAVVASAEDSDAQARFDAIQARDGLPCPDTGISHCRACHEVDGDPLGPRCGHWVGCPEC